MADGRDLQAALEASQLRLGPVEEQVMLNEFSEIEKRMRDFFSEEERRKQSREPYEFN